MRLVFNGHVLQPDTKTLKACGLFDNCVVHCLVHNPRPYSNLTTNQGSNLSEQGSAKFSFANLFENKYFPSDFPTKFNQILFFIENNHQAGISMESGNNSAASVNAGQRLLFLGMFLICLTLVFCWYFR